MSVQSFVDETARKNHEQSLVEMMRKIKEKQERTQRAAEVMKKAHLEELDRQFINCGTNQQCIEFILHNQMNVEKNLDAYGRSFYEAGHDLIVNFPEYSESAVIFLTELWANQDPDTAKTMWEGIKGDVKECLRSSEDFSGCLGSASFDGALALTGVGLAKQLNRVDDLLGGGKITTLSKAERIDLLFENLKKAPTVNTPDEVINLINRELDAIEDLYSGVSKQTGIPTYADGRMYGILDDKYITKNADGSINALTTGHRIEIQANGTFEVFNRLTNELLLTK